MGDRRTVELAELRALPVLTLKPTPFCARQSRLRHRCRTCLYRRVKMLRCYRRLRGRFYPRANALTHEVEPWAWLEGRAWLIGGLAWMAVLTLAMLFEKTGKGGERGVVPIGLGLISLGVLVLLHPAWLPSLFDVA